MSAVNQVWPCKRSIWSEVTRWQLQTFVNLLFNCQPLSIPPIHPWSCLCVSAWLSVNNSVSSRHAGSCTIKPAHPALPFPAVTGKVGTRREKAMDAMKRVAEKEGTRVTALVFLSPGGGRQASPSEEIYLKEKDFSLSACQWESRDRGGNLFFLLSNKDKEKNNFSFLCSWGVAEPATGRLLITHCKLN